MSDQPDCAVRHQLHEATESLRRAHAAFVDRAIGPETAANLRSAARHVLQAGLAALDRAERPAKAS
jgi:hypothetical protein